MEGLRFRAWDKLDKKMYYHVGMSMIGVQVYKTDSVPEEVVLDRGMDCFDVMQSTCLKDKNGKEIYEGDIVEVTEETIGKDVIVRGVVELDILCWMLDFPQYGESHEMGRFYTDDPDDFHVIGNIYHGPQLVEDEEN